MCTMPPAANRAELEALLYDDLRLDREDLAELGINDIAFLAGRYPSRNVGKLAKYLKDGLEDE